MNLHSYDTPARGLCQGLTQAVFSLWQRRWQPAGLKRRPSCLLWQRRWQPAGLKRRPSCLLWQRRWQPAGLTEDCCLMRRARTLPPLPFVGHLRLASSPTGRAQLRCPFKKGPCVGKWRRSHFQRAATSGQLPNKERTRLARVMQSGSLMLLFFRGSAWARRPSARNAAPAGRCRRSCRSGA